MTVPGLTAVTVPYFFRRADVDNHCDGSTPVGTKHDIGKMPVELSLDDANGGLEIVGQGRVRDFVAVVLKAGRFDAGRSSMPAVEKEDRWRQAGILGRHEP